MSYPLVHQLSFPQNTLGNSYNKVRRLVAEDLIADATGEDLGFDVLQLTKKGFTLVRHDLGELKEQRFNPQSVAHDYWATAFQLGSFLHCPFTDVTHITEQEVQSLDLDLLPTWIPKSQEHIPDGFFQIATEEASMRFALEVDLNLKSPLRYDKAAYHFDGVDSQIDVVFWLCGSLNVAEHIFDRLQNAKLRRLDIHHFLLTDDFRKRGWNAKARSGQFSGKSIQEICTWKPPGKPMEKAWKPYGKEEMEILFPSSKTPFKKRG